ncbi:MAG: trimethylamine methyltransferase family protein [Solirubrobacteraceae bacterium]
MPPRTPARRGGAGEDPVDRPERDHSAGWLVSCYEKFIVDLELLRELRHEFTPLEIDRECFYRPLLSCTENFDRWTKKGARDATVRAGEIWRTTLEEYVPPPIDAAIDAELREFVARRRAELGD